MGIDRKEKRTKGCGRGTNIYRLQRNEEEYEKRKKKKKRLRKSRQKNGKRTRREQCPES